MIAPLGNNAKSASPPPGDVLTPEMKRRENRAKRYEYQAVARQLFINEGQKCGLPHPMDYHRTAKCGWVPHGEIKIFRSQEHGSAFYAGLVTCGSVWSCPVCAAKIQERRREEIVKAIIWAYNRGLKCILVTLTFPHKSWQTLAELLEQQVKALKKLRGGKAWVKIKEGMGFEGLIRSFELTYGENAWNPHTHELWIVDNLADAEWVKAKTLERWSKACIKVGLLDPNNELQMKAFEQHGVHVIDRASCSDYLAKQDDTRVWGVDRELAKSSTKIGRKSGRHPFAFLETAGSNPRDAELWIEYSEVMKGKRQIFWSHGLKKTVGVNEKTDEELAEEQREDAETVAMITRNQWEIVKKEGAREELLDIAEVYGFDGLQAWFKLRGCILRKERAEFYTEGIVMDLYY